MITFFKSSSILSYKYPHIFFTSMYKNMLSVAMRKSLNTSPLEIPKDLPKSTTDLTVSTNKQIESPSRNIKCTSDNMNFGISPPGKNFLINLKSRMEKM